MNVSVVIPTYNRAATVGEAVASALGQTYDRLEVVVVDDGSTDGTRERLAAVADRRLRYVRQPNRGVSAARNTGVRAATGELIAFLDSDDLWKPDKLEREVAFLAGHPEAAAIFADLEKLDGAERVPSFMRASPVFARLLARLGPAADGVVLDQRAMFLCLLAEVPILPSAFSIRRRAFETTGPFDESWSSWEDWEFFLRFARRHRFGYLDRPLAVLRISRDSLHRVDAERGRATMARLLLRQRAELGRDPEAAAAIRAGLVGLRTHMGWDYLRRGRRGAAARALVRGFAETREPALLLRAAAALLPPRVRERARRALWQGVEA